MSIIIIIIIMIPIKRSLMCTIEHSG